MIQQAIQEFLFLLLPNLADSEPKNGYVSYMFRLGKVVAFK